MPKLKHEIYHFWTVIRSASVVNGYGMGKGFKLWNMDFEVDSKTVVDKIYGKQIGVLEFSEITSKCAYA